MQRKLQEDAAAKWLQKYTAAAAAGSKAAAASPGVPATGGPAAAGVDDAPSSQFSGQSTFTAAAQSMAAAAEAAQPLGLLARCLCAKARPQQQQRQQRSVLLQTAAAPAVQLVAQPQPPRHVVQTGAGTIACLGPPAMRRLCAEARCRRWRPRTVPEHTPPLPQPPPPPQKRSSC